LQELGGDVQHVCEQVGGPLGGAQDEGARVHDAAPAQAKSRAGIQA
jgi:hypothetical protein